jgi:hypothetical protein
VLVDGGVTLPPSESEFHSAYVTIRESIRTCAVNFAMANEVAGVANTTVTLSLLTVTVLLVVPIEFFKAVA